MSREEFYNFLWQYIWLFGFALSILSVHLWPNNHIIKFLGPSMIIFFLGIFLSIKYITRIENKILLAERQNRIWIHIKPLLIKRIELNFEKIYANLYYLDLIYSEVNIERPLLHFRENDNINYKELGLEFEKISTLILSDDIKNLEVVKDEGSDESIINSNDILIKFYKNIFIYLKDIRYNIAPLFFIHSENAGYIIILINLIGNISIIEDEISKYDNKLNNDVLYAFSILFKNIGDICKDILPNTNNANDLQRLIPKGMP